MNLSAQEKKWRQEDDARSLARANEIMENKSRYKGAIDAAKRMAIEEEKKTKAMKKVAARKVTAKKKPKKKSTKKKTAKKKTKK